jgi:ankyrin repeat protein
MNIGNAFLPIEMLDAIGSNFDVHTTLMVSHVSKEFKDWAKRIGLPMRISIRALLRTSASIGTAACLKYVYGLSSNYDCDFEVESSIIAAFRGNLEVLKHVVSNSVATDFRDAATFALIGGQGECLKYLIENDSGLFVSEEHEEVHKFDLYPALLRAITCGLSDAVEILLDMGASEDVSNRWTLCAEAAESGNLEILELLHCRGLPCGSSAASAAAYWGRANCLRYMIKSGCIQSKDETLE